MPCSANEGLHFKKFVSVPDEIVSNTTVKVANSADPDQTPHFVEFDMYTICSGLSVQICRNKVLIALVRGYQIFFLFFHENICYGYSLEVPQRGTSNEYPQQMLWRNKKMSILSG